MKYGVPRLVNGLVRDLFREDAAAYYRDLLAYAVPELETLESAFAWIDRLAAAALSGADKLLDDFDQALPAKTLHGELASQECGRAEPSRRKGGSTKSAKRLRPAK
jgi:FAD-dependent urate hydroxylase